jgi:hypothetical protein
MDPQQPEPNQHNISGESDNRLTRLPPFFKTTNITVPTSEPCRFSLNLDADFTSTWVSSSAFAVPDLSLHYFTPKVPTSRNSGGQNFVAPSEVNFSGEYHDQALLGSRQDPLGRHPLTGMSTSRGMAIRMVI